MATGNYAGEPKRTLRIPGVSPLLLVPLLVVIVQATLIARIRVGGVCPDLLLVVVVAWSLLRGIGAGIAWSFVGGLFFDMVAGLPLGTSSLALMTVCFVTGLGESNLFQGNIFLPIIAVAIATPLHAAIVLLAMQLQHVHVDWLGVALRVVLPEMFLNMATMILVYPMLRWLADKVSAERLNW